MIDLNIEKYIDKDLLFNTIELQHKLNVEICGPHYLSRKKTREDRDINWKTYIIMEAGELLDSLNIKHWKDIDKLPDKENIKTECIDIAHFLYSYLLETTKDRDFREMFDKSYVTIDNTFLYDFKEPDTTYLYDMQLLCEEIMKPIVAKDNYMNLPNAIYNAIASINVVLRKHYGLTPHQQYVSYLAKYSLNKFRLANGYKEGTYKKYWNGQEDNVLVNLMLETMVENDFDFKQNVDDVVEEIMQNLTISYKLLER